MFGFQLSNIIPGFPRHPMYFVDPPYELLASQDSDHSRVSNGHSAVLLNNYMGDIGTHFFHFHALIHSF